MNLHQLTLANYGNLQIDKMIIARIRNTDKKEQRLWDHTWNVARLCELTGSTFGLRSTCKLIGLLHDMGKATTRFYKYLVHQVSHPEKPLPKDNSPHSPTGAIFAWKRWRNGGAYRMIAAQIIAMVIRGHHGGMLDCVDSNAESPLLYSLNQDADRLFYNEAVEHYIGEICVLSDLDELFDEAEREITRIISQFLKDGKREFYFYCGLLSRLLLGILVDADRHDAACFDRSEDPFIEKPIRADWTELQGRLDEYVKKFPQENQVDKLRQYVSDVCFKCAGRETRIFRLTVPTGLGKTLSSLRYGLAEANIRELYRIFYVIPFNTILDQNAKSIREALGDYEGILEHHGDLAFDDENEYRSHTRLTDRWNSPIILTSMVQFLNSLFGGKNTYARRMPAIARSVIIFDEIQALPKKCTHLFELAVRYLTDICDCSVVLCTATQPSLRLNAVEMMPDPVRLNASLQRARYINQTDIPRTLEQAARDIISLQAEHGAVLTVVNTRAQAAALYEQAAKDLPGDVLIIHLSTDMCAEHRIDMIFALISALDAKKPVLCISTSLIEAGIDISFPCVVRFYAGLASILQAGGRCNRHGELPEQGFVYIWRIADEKISRLEDVRIGQRCAPEAFEMARKGNRLDSPEVITAYFNKERNEYANKLSYPVEKTDLVTLLSTNKPDARLALHQAFKTAGEAFKVIDNATFPIVAPYGKAEELLVRLNGEHTIKQEYAILRELQTYMVNVYENVYKKLESSGALYAVGETGIIALRGEYYDSKLGVRQFAGEMPFEDY